MTELPLNTTRVSGQKQLLKNHWISGKIVKTSSPGLAGVWRPSLLCAVVFPQGSCADIRRIHRDCEAQQILHTQ